MSEFVTHPQTGAVMATEDGMRRVIGDRIDRLANKAYCYWPIGRRILVIADDIPQTTDSGIVVPEHTRQMSREQIGAGVVFACGATVGINEGPHPGGPILKHPSELLYQHVFFSGFSGQFVQLFFSKKPQWDQWLFQLTDRDLWLIDSSPPSEWESIG